MRKCLTKENCRQSEFGGRCHQGSAHKKVLTPDRKEYGLAYLEEAIEKVIGTTRKERTKVIKLVQKKHLEWSDSNSMRKRFFTGQETTKPNQGQFFQSDFCSAKSQSGMSHGLCERCISQWRMIRTLNIADQFNQQYMGIEVDYNLPARRVIEVVERVIDRYGKPMKIRTDNGPELVEANEMSTN